MFKKVLLGFGFVVLMAAPSYASETRCGWLDNPTPGNWWLVDSDESWTISAQGGYRAKGMDNIPDLTSRQFVRTNGYYGYACACMEVTTNKRLGRIVTIESVEQLSLKQCRQDPKLPDRP